MEGTSLTTEVTKEEHNSTFIWVPHDESVWKRASVIRKSSDGSQVEVRCEATENEYNAGDIETFSISEISQLSGKSFVCLLNECTSSMLLNGIRRSIDSCDADM